MEIFTILGTATGLAGFFWGLYQFRHANAIRRYEKFHEMSKRFDESEEIQAVCRLLHGTEVGPKTLTKQDKEVFICFLEEIHFMVKSKIMKRYLALYSFGYYGKLALNCKEFWHDLDRSNPFYTHFLEYCEIANEFPAGSNVAKNDLKY